MALVCWFLLASKKRSKKNTPKANPPQNRSVRIFGLPQQMTSLATSQHSIISLTRKDSETKPHSNTLYLSDSESSDDEDDWEDEEIEDLVTLKKRISSTARQGRRSTVMAKPIKIDPTFNPPIYLKKSVDHRSLQSALHGNFLFQLDVEELDIVLDAFEPWEVLPNTTVITQGDLNANYFYVVSDGSVHIIVNNELVVELGKGNSFGELALLYDAPRSATVKISPKGVAKLWRLDRKTFKSILVNTHERELVQRVRFLSKVPILSQLSSVETKQLAEAMTSVMYESGKTIIKEGEIGGTFFVVASGEVKFLNAEGKEISARGTPGSYFGEISLLQNERRKCDVVSTQATKCLVLERKMFKQIFGKCEDVLKRNMEMYNKFKGEHKM